MSDGCTEVGCYMPAGHPPPCGCDECDDCDGSGAYYLNKEPQRGHCQDYPEPKRHAVLPTDRREGGT